MVTHQVSKTNKQTNSEIILIAPSNIYPYILLCLYETGRIFGATQYSLHIRSTQSPSTKVLRYLNETESEVLGRLEFMNFFYFLFLDFEYIVVLFCKL